MADEDEKNELQEPKQKFYLTLTEGNFYYYSNEDWILLNPQIDDIALSALTELDEISGLLSTSVLNYAELSSLFIPMELSASFAQLSGENSFLGNQEVSGFVNVLGEEIVNSNNSINNLIPLEGKIYKHTLTSNDIISFNISSLLSTYVRTFELHLIQPSAAVSFTFSNTIKWNNENNFNSSNDAPDFSEGNKLYAIVFRWDGEDFLGNLAYTKDIESN